MRNLFVAACLAFVACGGTKKNTGIEEPADMASQDAVASDAFDPGHEYSDAPADIAEQETGADSPTEDTTPGPGADEAWSEAEEAPPEVYKDGDAPALDAADHADLPPGELDVALADEGASPECEDKQDCDDQDPCTVDQCIDGACNHVPKECAPGLDCIEGACGEMGCAYTPVVSMDCYQVEAVFMEDFEQVPLDSFTFQDLAKNVPSEEAMVWHQSKLRAHSGTHSALLGKEDGSGFDTGKVVASVAWTRPVTPQPQGGKLELVFYLWADVEEGDEWDLISVVVETEQASIPVWSKSADMPMKEWIPVIVDISAFKGMSFRIGFIFNSVDFTMNDGEGVYLDDVFLLVHQAQEGCSLDEDCDDGVTCTQDHCEQGNCAYTFADNCCQTATDCDDFDTCTNDLCDQGACVHVPVGDPLCCNTDSDCEDGNPCTTNTCEKNKCKMEVSTAPGCCSQDNDCDDKDPCTIDTCMEYQCKHTNICCQSDEECDDGDDVCTIDKCVQGSCMHEPTGVEGCCVPQIALFDFENQMQNQQWQLGEPVGGVGFHIVETDHTTSGSWALYYGNPDTNDFDNGEENAGWALSPPIQLPQGYPVKLEAQVFMDTESSSSYDVLRFLVESDGIPTTMVWTKPYLDSDQTGVFFGIEADLSAWAGRTIRLRLEFETGDSLINDGLGVFVDDISLTTTCQQRTCEAAGDCDDGVEDTEQDCKDGVCQYSFP